eukprot:5619869-Pyramimonas_sp.AAC.1
MMYKMYRASGMPLAWNLSNGVAITSKRVIHVLCPFGKACIASCICPSQRNVEPNFARGCVAARRRKTPMMVQQSLGWRLRRLGLPFMRDHKQVTNAFGSTSVSSLAASNDAIMRGSEARLGRHRYLNAAVCFQGPE